MTGKEMDTQQRQLKINVLNIEQYKDNYYVEPMFLTRED